jgi:hypothetical protein
MLPLIQEQIENVTAIIRNICWRGRKQRASLAVVGCQDSIYLLRVKLWRAKSFYLSKD